jgi:hypothetical protein
VAPLRVYSSSVPEGGTRVRASIAQWGWAMPLPNHILRRRRGSSRPRRIVDERGASMVEMALVLPLFLILVFGIMEFSYVFAQNNEIRNAVRETAREAGIDGDQATVTGLLCSSFDLIDPTEVVYRFTAVSAAPGGEGGIAELTARATYRTLTGFFDSMFVGVQLESRHNFYVEPDVSPGPGWSGAAGSC